MLVSACRLVFDTVSNSVFSRTQLGLDSVLPFLIKNKKVDLATAIKG